METVATCSTTDGNGSYHGLTPSFFEEMTRCRRKKNIAGGDQTILMLHRNSANNACTFRIYVCLCLCDLDCCSAAYGSGSCHAPAPSYFEEITRCRRQKLHWRWPGNPNGRSKFCNLGLFTFTRSQITLRRRLRCFWRSLKQHVSDVKNIAGWPGLIQIPQIRKFMPTKSSKTSLKTSFSCYERRRDWRHCALFFSCYHWQRLLFSHLKNNFSTTLTPPKNRDIRIVEFFWYILFIAKP